MITEPQKPVSRWSALWFCGVLCFCGVSWSSLGYAWEIARFETRVDVHEDATARVTETIIADFTGEDRHGVYRDIPIHYTDRIGQHVRLRLRVREVMDGAGHAWRHRLESAGRYQRIRVGDPNVTVTGLQTYRLVYDVERGAIRFFPDHDECYWNLTGNEWAVPIRQVRAEVVLPEGTADLRAVAYIGTYGSREQLREVRLSGHRVVLESSRSLEPYEGLTAAIGWAKGMVHPPTAVHLLRWWLADNWVYGIPLLVLLGMTRWWQVRGREPRTDRSQVVEYEPPDGLTPAEMGTLMDQRANLRDITATVIDLAVRGYLRVEAVEAVGSTLLGQPSDYRLARLKGWTGDATIKPHERDLLTELFGVGGTKDAVSLSGLQYEFYDRLPAIREHLYQGLMKAGYLDSNPEKIRKRYVVGAAVIGIGLWWLLDATQPWHQVPDVPIILAAGLSALIVCLVGLAMPRRTLKGARTTDHIFGFIEFLRRTDQDRIRRINDPSLFERCLPYALAFGVADQWARAFAGLYTQPPAWYQGHWERFSVDRFGHDLDHATSSMGRVFSAQPRGSSGSWGGSGFGGGGFSGGGGGGGGGGAW